MMLGSEERPRSREVPPEGKEGFFFKSFVRTFIKLIGLNSIFKKILELLFLTSVLNILLLFYIIIKY